MTEFTLHDRLAADTLEVTRWPLSRVLLMNASQWPWLVLVPQRVGIREIHDLAPADQAILMQEISLASRTLAALARPDKINIGALGNLVPQLHVHVIARYKADPAWPKPVWGSVTPAPYAASELQTWVHRLNAAFADSEKQT